MDSTHENGWIQKQISDFDFFFDQNMTWSMEHGAYNLQNIIYKQQQKKTLTGKRGKKTLQRKTNSWVQLVRRTNISVKRINLIELHWVGLVKQKLSKAVRLVSELVNVKTEVY